MRRQVRPTYVIGVGTQGARVAAEVRHLVDASSIPMVNALAVCEAAIPLPATLAVIHMPLADVAQGGDNESAAQSAQLRDVVVLQALDDLYRVNAVRMARARGWEIRRAEGGVVFLVIAQSAQAWVATITTSLRAAIAQRPARRLALVGVALGTAENDDAHDAFTEFTTALSSQHLCVEGFYTIAPVNAYGLTAASDSAWEQMIAQWIVEMVTTPLGLSVAASPLDSGNPDVDGEMPCWGSVGLAHWQLPIQSLVAWLSRNLQRDMLDNLLWPGGEADMAALAVIRDRCLSPNVMPELPKADFATGRSAWVRPDLRSIGNVRAEIDTAATTMLAQAEAVIQGWDNARDKALVRATQALDIELAQWIDAPRPGCLPNSLALLSAARCAFLAEAGAAEAKAQAQEAERVTRLEVLAVQGAALTDTINRFPAWSWRAWWRIIRRPWRWPAVFKTYREIVLLVEAYIATYEALWLSLLRACEARWRAQYAQALADNVDERLSVVQTAITELSARRNVLTAEISAAQMLDQLLDSAALPASLKTHFYTRNVAQMEGEVLAAFAASGGLSTYLCPDFRAHSLLSTLADYAFERFAFLEAVRLDELLVHTYSGAELRARLSELVEAAVPFWPWDADTVSLHMTGGFLKRTWIGLPSAGESQLVDLLPDHGIECYSTGDPSTITVTQVWRERETQTEIL